VKYIVLAASAYILYLLLRHKFRKNPRQFSKYFLYVVVGGAIGIIFFLAFTGRLHWLVAIFAGLVPLAGRLMSLLRFLPFLKAAQSFFASRGTLGSSGRPNASKVRSRFLEMELNHGNGAVVGEVIEGQFKGTLLNNLDIEQLKRLWLECQQDSDSISLLSAYAKRRFGENWQDHFSKASDAGGAGSSGQMSQEEALQILGLGNGAQTEEIRLAHRRLMQRYHPDRGGSDYLAAKINQAKELLLKK